MTTIQAGFNGTEQSIATPGGTGTAATWTFNNLPTGTDPYYDVYVTWNPQSSAATNALYAVVDGTGPTITAVSQQIAPADYQADGVFWHNLGVFQVTSGTTLVVQLNGNASPVLADAVQLVACDAAPAGNMSLYGGAFSINAQGQMSVTYTVNSTNGSSVVPFSIGICGSPDKTQPTNVLQEYQVTDPSMLTPGQHTALIDAALSGLTEDDYLVAKLDVNNQVYQTAQSGSVSAPATLPPGGVFQQSDGSLYVLGVPDSTKSNNTDDNVGVTQDPNSGNVTITTTTSTGTPVTNTFSGVSSVTISTPLGGNSVAVDPTMPVSVFGGAASSTNGNTGTGVSGQTANLPTISVVGNSNAQPAVFYVESGGVNVTSNVVVNCSLSASSPPGTYYTLTDANGHTISRDRQRALFVFRDDSGGGGRDDRHAHSDPQLPVEQHLGHIDCAIQPRVYCQ